MEWIEQYRTQIAWLLGIVCTGGAFLWAGGGEWLSNMKAKLPSATVPPAGADAREELTAILVRAQVICRDELKSQPAVDHLAAVQAELMKVPELTRAEIEYRGQVDPRILKQTPMGFSKTIGQLLAEGMTIEQIHGGQRPPPPFNPAETKG